MSERTILIVDDEPDVVTYLATFLRESGFAVLTAGNGKEGFEAATAHLPDLITLDITMPEESGVRMLRDLQEDPRTTAIPVVIITGVAHEFKQFIQSRKHLRPPAAYFEKPVDREELLAAIRSLLAGGGTIQ